MIGENASRPCPDCDGDGMRANPWPEVHRPAIESCLTCGGSGYLTQRLVAPDVVCPDCRGDGRAKPNKTLSLDYCPRCDGSGRIGPALGVQL